MNRGELGRHTKWCERIRQFVRELKEKGSGLMFRLAREPFKENQELRELATYCMTKTIEHQLKNYFEAGWQNEPAETLYTKVKKHRIYRLVPDELIEELEEANLDAYTFLAKKIAQMMLELRSEEEITFDILNEYLLAKMILMRRSRGLSGLAPEVKRNLDRLKRLVHDYVSEYLAEDFEFEPGEQEVYEEEMVASLTQFSAFFSNGRAEESEFIFWDYDFALFDECGLWRALAFFTEPSAFCYGEDYIKDIFYSVGEQCFAA